MLVETSCCGIQFAGNIFEVPYHERERCVEPGKIVMVVV